MTRNLRRYVVAGLLALSPVGAFAATTQIVVQWIDGMNGVGAGQLFHLQSVLDDEAGRVGYVSDGNDIGSGTTNFYLYAEDAHVDSVVKELIDMQRRKLLPAGMRIGVAIYKDAKRREWDYRPVYPKGLTQFDIMYRAKKN